MRGGARAVLALQGKSKPFGTIEALKRIHRRLRPGEVIGLMRHNDAGKSTLVSMVAQNTSTCSGRIPLHGKPQPSREPEDARQHGIEVIHPDLARSVAQRAGEDVFLGCKLWRRIGLVRPPRRPAHVCARRGPFRRAQEQDPPQRDLMRMMLGRSGPSDGHGPERAFGPAP